MYYPKSQITPDLYTGGGELTRDNTNEYVGYYYEISTGQKFTGRNPNAGGNEELFPLPISSRGDENIPPNQEDLEVIIVNFPGDPDPTVPEPWVTSIVSDYLMLTNPTLPSFRSTPVPSRNFPNEKSYELGEFRRYFAKKNNELRYMEIGAESFKAFMKGGDRVASDLWSVVSIPWNIIGDKTQTFNTNKGVVEIYERRKKWYGFSSFFNNQFLKYHISEQNENLYTGGGEYTLPTGENYVGFYHIMDKGIAMTGKKHGKGGDIILKPTSPTKSSSSPSPSPLIPQTPQIPNIPNQSGY